MAFIIHWNCRGLLNNFGDVKEILHDFSPVALCLQETNLGDRYQNILKGFTVVRRDRTQASRLSGGVAVVVKGGIAVREIHINSHIEAAAVTIVAHKTITVCSLYIPPHTQFTVSDLELILDQLPEPFVIAGDFNAHNTLWGSKTVDSRGQTLEDFILANDVCLLNSGAATYCSPSSGAMSCLDLALCSPALFTDFKWKVIDNPYGSDHMPALISLTTALPTIPSRPPRWRLHLADWALFTDQASLDKESLDNLSVDEMNQRITTCIIAAAKRAIPQSSGCLKKNLKPWWTHECTEAKKLQNKAWGIFRRYPTYDNLISFKKAKAKARYVRRQAEKISWQNYVSSINSSVTSKRMWDQVRKFNGNYAAYTIPFLSTTGTQTSLQEQADLLGLHFYNISSSANYSETFLRHKQSIEKQKLPTAGFLDLPYNAPLTIHELNTVLSTGKKTAPGPDTIHYAMLAHLSPKTVEALLFFFNVIWQTGRMPTDWKKAIIIPFLKTGKDSTLANSYRPIALTSCLAKTYESVINIRLTYVLETENSLDIHQCGYKKGCSTIDHLVRLENTIREAFLHKQHCLAVFFDLQKAYDTTWRYGILRDLADLGIRGRMLNCLSDFLSNRTFQVRLGVTLSRVFTQENGVPQGCVLSTTLFVVKMNSVNKVIPSTLMHSLYVDDLQIACRASNMVTCQRQTQITLNKLTQWAEKNGFCFSGEKTVAVVYSQKRGLQPDPILELNATVLPVKQEHKFLGVIFDKKLNFLSHITSLKIKATRALNVLKVLSRKRWGADRKCLLHIYRSLVRSKLDYGSVVYGSARQSYLKRLDPVHNKGIRLATGAYRTSPLPSLYSESNEPALDSRRTQLMLTYVLRVRSSPNHICYNIITHCDKRLHYTNKPNAIRPLILRFEEKCRECNVPTDALSVTKRPRRLPPWKNFTQFLDLSLTHLKKQGTPREHILQEFRIVQERYSTYKEFYTDGSKTASYVSSSVVQGAWEETVRLPRFVSVFTAECYALWMAVKRIESARYKKAILFTDSLSALKALHIRSQYEPFIGDILSVLSRLSEGQNIRFCWVPSHVGIPGNERADQCAAAAKNLSISQVNVPVRDSIRAIRTALTSKWQREWNMTGNNKLQLIKPFLNEWKSCYHQERFIEVILCRLRIGHTHITHNYLLKQEKQPTCDKCDEPLTVLHILLTCAHLEAHRRKHFYTLYKLRIPRHPMFLLGDDALIPLTDVVNFLDDTKFLNKL